MAQLPDDLSFEDWLRYVFDHPATEKQVNQGCIRERISIDRLSSDRWPGKRRKSRIHGAAVVAAGDHPWGLFLQPQTRCSTARVSWSTM
jgi:hypothetical protein